MVTRQKLEGWTLLLAVSKGQVYRTQTGCDMYQPRWDQRAIHRVHKFRVDKRVREGLAAGLVKTLADFGTYELTDTGWDELRAAQPA